MIDVFGGYNHNLRIGEGEFYDMENLTSSDYPVLSPRPKRGLYASPDADSYPDSNVIKVSNPQGMIEKQGLCYVDGSTIVIPGHEPIEMGLSEHYTMCPKTLISMGAYIIIMPDKKYINTNNVEDNGKIEATFETTSIIMQPCKIDGTAYGEDEIVNSDTAPNPATDGMLWLDTSKTPYSLKQYSKTNEDWITISTTYVRISFPFEHYLDFIFSVGDSVTISDLPFDLGGTKIIRGIGDNYIVITGIIGYEYGYNGKISVTRLMPEMDMVIESGNRLWGCRYGEDIHGNFVNEIYASKLGDFKNWHVFDGISTDSYAASVGTEGEFTGAVTHLGYPIFFKENCMHKVYGNFPANFQIQTTTCRGVQEGCAKSLAIVNEVLYYKSRNGICAYDGSLPQEISSALGDVSYHDAAAGAIKNKYYISMANDDGTYHLFVFDTKRGLWHKEDYIQAIDFCAYKGNLYYIEKFSDEIKTVLGVGSPKIETEPIKWMAESGIIGTNLPDKKYISRLDVRMRLTVGTRVHFYIEYDSSGQREHLFTMTGRTLQSFAVPIRPHRCDHMRIRIEGDGDAKIYSVCKTIEQGSDH
jgi:hypothetical protein